MGIQSKEEFYAVAHDITMLYLQKDDHLPIDIASFTEKYSEVREIVEKALK